MATQKPDPKKSDPTTTPPASEATAETPKPPVDAAPPSDADQVKGEPHPDVTTPDPVSLVYEGEGPLTIETDEESLTVYPGALLLLPVIGQVKTLVSGGALRRL